MSELRQRNVSSSKRQTEHSQDKPSAPEEDKKQKLQQNLDNNLHNSYWFTRIVFLRSLAFIYFVAFLVALHQNKALLGKHGLLPTDQYISRIKQHFHTSSPFEMFLHIPTILLFINESEIDFWLDVLAYIGIVLSLFVFIMGSSNMIIMTILWLVYHSIVNVGQRWYGFGWESQLLETGFLAIFFCPFLSLNQLPSTNPSITVVWGYRWLIFRIMIGAGLIKIRGDQCWRDLTCMNYHYQTQPVPNPISYYLHQSPEIMHKFETFSNHFIELIAPFFILLTRKMRLFGGGIQIFFQIVLIISGNLSFLNWLTILPSICCFDDQSLSFLFNHSKQLQLRSHVMKESLRMRKASDYICRILDFSLAGLLLFLSIPVIQNLLSSNQAMNTSFDSFRIVNTYGAFGSVTKTRTEVVLQGTQNKTLIENGIWLEYEFKCKPGNVSRRPCFISPYHYRLDWLMWFAAFMNYQQNPWLLHLTAKLLKNDKNITSLIAHNPFENDKPPRFIRGAHFKYEYTKIGENTSDWWKREYIGEYFPPVNLRSLRSFLRAHGW